MLAAKIRRQSDHLDGTEKTTRESQAAPSLDDIVRANDGAYFGLASEF